MGWGSPGDTYLVYRDLGYRDLGRWAVAARTAIGVAHTDVLSHTSTNAQESPLVFTLRYTFVDRLCPFAGFASMFV
jgi:hypothetical protein